MGLLTIGAFARTARLSPKALRLDHTWVQSLVDDARLSPEEADSHPRRALLVRAITSGGGHQPDLFLHDAAAGDRYLLCSDGLTPVVPMESMGAALRRGTSPHEAVDEQIAWLTTKVHRQHRLVGQPCSAG